MSTLTLTILTILTILSVIAGGFITLVFKSVLKGEDKKYFTILISAIIFIELVQLITYFFIAII